MLLVRYYAGAAAAAGRPEEKVEAADLPALRAILVERHGARMERILVASSLLVDGVAVRDDAAELRDGCTVEVLPPFAGG
jgi:molybdopterin synthase sulfur carrier subunit